MASKNLDEVAIENFQKYVQIPSLSQETDYVDCVNFLKKQAESLGLSFEVLQLAPKRLMVILVWHGVDPTLPCILLNSHMDVVPVEPSKWSHPPFSAHIDPQGRIFGRGTQDMKCVGVQYLEAIRRLQGQKVKLKRTLVLTYVPDEELGGHQGMKLFLQTQQFKELNIAFALDEGCASDDLEKKHMYLFHAEKHKWIVKFHCQGQVGHGSLNLDNTAGEKLSRLLQCLYDFRAGEIQRSQDVGWCTDVVSLNVTKITGGQQENVIPSEFEVTTDIRLPPNIDLENWKEKVKNWCRFSGENVWAEEIICEAIDEPLDYENCKFFHDLENCLKGLGIVPISRVVCATSDARFLRSAGVPVVGFSPLTGKRLMHAHDEFLDRGEFLRGIEVYVEVFKSLGDF